MHVDLSGRIALVTGASRGIGAAIAASLAESGAQVALHYRRSDDRVQDLASRLNNGSRPFRADLVSLDETSELFDAVVGHYGRLDILVNNAGISRYSPLHSDLDEWNDAWEQTMKVNLRASELLSRLAIRHFQTRSGGRIIFVASRAAFRGDTPDYMAYAASKGGMVALARSIARGFGRDGITSFVVAPGFTRTDMAREFIDEYGEAFALQDIALDRMTEPADIAPLVTFLASGLADHATGSSIDVNAGSYVR